MVNGVQCVIMDGITLMLEWYVDNWDLDHQDQLINQLIMDKEQDASGWVTFHALELNLIYLIVAILIQHLKIVHILMMLVYTAAVIIDVSYDILFVLFMPWVSLINYVHTLYIL